MPFFVVGLVLLSAVTHASWNLLARQRSASDIFLRILLVITSGGLPLALLGEFVAQPVLPSAWMILPVSGVFQAIYFWGVTRGYRVGDFTIVYPLSRALPVLLIAFVDLARGHPPAPLGWLGIIFVTVGCVMIPLESLRGVTWARYWNRTILWVIVIASSIVGYTICDSLANQNLQGGASTALRYNIYESSLSLVGYVLILKWASRRITATDLSQSWRFPVVAALMVFGSYSLILWAYQLTPYASYVSAIRQVSIVIGAIVGALLFREPAPVLRIVAAVIILMGVVCIALA